MLNYLSVSFYIKKLSVLDIATKKEVKADANKVEAMFIWNKPINLKSLKGVRVDKDIIGGSLRGMRP
jgi:hypothetical protein